LLPSPRSLACQTETAGGNPGERGGPWEAMAEALLGRALGRLPMSLRKRACKPRRDGCTGSMGSSLSAIHFESIGCSTTSFGVVGLRVELEGLGDVSRTPTSSSRSRISLEGLPLLKRWDALTGGIDAPSASTLASACGSGCAVEEELGSHGWPMQLEVQFEGRHLHGTHTGAVIKSSPRSSMAGFTGML